MRESVESVDKALALNPNQSLANYQLAIFFMTTGNTKDALVVFKGLEKKIIDADITLSSISKDALHKKVLDAIDRLSKNTTSSNTI